MLSTETYLKVSNVDRTKMVKYVLLVSITCMHNAFKFFHENFFTKIIGTKFKKINETTNYVQFYSNKITQ